MASTPRTGEVLDPGSPIESAQVVRALHIAVVAIDSQMQKRTAVRVYRRMHLKSGLRSRIRNSAIYLIPVRQLPLLRDWCG